MTELCYRDSRAIQLLIRNIHTEWVKKSLWSFLILSLHLWSHTAYPLPSSENTVIFVWGFGSETPQNSVPCVLWLICQVVNIGQLYNKISDSRRLGVQQKHENNIWADRVSSPLHLGKVLFSVENCYKLRSQKPARSQLCKKSFLRIRHKSMTLVVFCIET